MAAGETNAQAGSASSGGFMGIMYPDRLLCRAYTLPNYDARSIADTLSRFRRPVMWPGVDLKGGTDERLLELVVARAIQLSVDDGGEHKKHAGMLPHLVMASIGLSKNRFFYVHVSRQSGFIAGEPVFETITHAMTVGIALEARAAFEALDSAKAIQMATAERDYAKSGRVVFRDQTTSRTVFAFVGSKPSQDPSTVD